MAISSFVVVLVVITVLPGSYEPNVQLSNSGGLSETESAPSLHVRETPPVTCGSPDAPQATCPFGSTLASGSDWTNLTPYYLTPVSSSAPPARYDASSAFDAADGYALVFGGLNAKNALGDTWSFANGSWTDRTPGFVTPEDTPSPRYGASMAFDAAMGAVILFGGRNLSAVSEFANLSSGDTWEYRGGSWTPIYAPDPVRERTP